MYKVKFWRTIATRAEYAEHKTTPMCEQLTDFGGKCHQRTAWVLTWTNNESALPGLGESRTAYVCSGHIYPRIDRIPFEYVGSVLITPYREEQV